MGWFKESLIPKRDPHNHQRMNLTIKRAYMTEISALVSNYNWCNSLKFVLIELVKIDWKYYLKSSEPKRLESLLLVNSYLIEEWLMLSWIKFHYEKVWDWRNNIKKRSIKREVKIGLLIDWWDIFEYRTYSCS